MDVARARRPVRALIVLGLKAWRNVSLRDASGAFYAFKRTPDLKVVKTDPLAAHIALLETITDKQMHDVVAYLETLK